MLVPGELKKQWDVAQNKDVVLEVLQEPNFPQILEFSLFECDSSMFFRSVGTSFNDFSCR